MNNIITTTKKLSLFICLMLLLTTIGFGQQTDNWYFGSPTIAGMGLRIDFSGGSPVVTRGYPLVTEEGSSSMSDASGNPLFYTDGQSIWDASTNTTFGTGLQGGQSATQSAIVMPKPGTTNQWLVFTSGQTAGASGTNGINYYTVTGTGSPGVSPFTISAATNLAGTNVVGEGLFIIGSTKPGSKFWVIARENGSTGVVRAWDVTNAGAVNPVAVTSTLSNAGWTQTNFAANIGTVKSNTCQNQLAFSYLNGDVDLTDFDTKTGMVKANTAKRITGMSTAGGNAGSYGLEFSPNDKYLFITDLAGKKVFVFDTTSASGVATTLATLAVAGNNEAGQLQLGPDGNIYMAIPGDGHLGNGYLGIISSPSTGGSFTENGLLVTTNANPNGYCYRGLPTFPKTLVVSNPTISPRDTTICQAVSINFKYGSYAGSISTVAWDFGDPSSGASNTSALVAPSHTFNNLGIFKVKVTITDLCSRQWKDSMNVTVVAAKTPAGTVACSGNNLVLDNPASDPDEPKYIWYKNSVATANIIGTGTPFNYTVGTGAVLPTQICVGEASAAPVVSSVSNHSIASSNGLTSIYASSPYTSPQINVLATTLFLKSFKIGFRFAATINLTVTIKQGATVVYNQTTTSLAVPAGTGFTVPVNTTLTKGNNYTILISTSPSGLEMQSDEWLGATNAGEIFYSNSTPANGYTGAVANLIYDASNITVTPACSAPACYSVACSLPIHLLYFTGKNGDTKNILNWATASETNNDFFEIQRSTDGINFFTIGTMKGSGNSATVHEYEFTDASPANGVNYYKLVQHDYNGDLSASSVLKITSNLNGSATFTVSPNPSNESFNISFQNISGGEFDILNVLGQTLTHKTVSSGTESISVGTELSKGAYILRFSGTSGTYTQLVIKE